MSGGQKGRLGFHVKEHSRVTVPLLVSAIPGSRCSRFHSVCCEMLAQLTANRPEFTASRARGAETKKTCNFRRGPERECGQHHTWTRSPPSLWQHHRSLGLLRLPHLGITKGSRREMSHRGTVTTILMAAPSVACCTCHTLACTLTHTNH